MNIEYASTSTLSLYRTHIVQQVNSHIYLDKISSNTAHLTSVKVQSAQSYLKIARVIIGTDLMATTDEIESNEDAITSVKTI